MIKYIPMKKPSRSDTPKKISMIEVETELERKPPVLVMAQNNPFHAVKMLNQ